jgi:hypothetical protein
MLIRRRIAGLVAIVAFVLSYSEALTAAACTMGTQAASTQAMDMAMPMPDSGDQQTPSHDQQQPDCPLSLPGSASNCIFNAALTPERELIGATTAPQTVGFARAGGDYQLILAESPFHPPKA